MVPWIFIHNPFERFMDDYRRTFDAWVSTGRSPHAGDPMPARDLHSILVASERAGLKGFLYHSSMHLGAAEWRVISGMCGNLWGEDPEGYWPSATEKPR